MEHMSEEERQELASLDTHDVAFQVWAMLADRSPTKTVTILRQEFGIEVKPNTVSQWVKRHNWLGKARELFHDAAPTFIERTAATLVGGAPDAARFLIEAANGSPSAQLDSGMVDRGRVVAAVAILDRVGFLPNTRKDAEKHGTPVHAGRGADVWASMSDAELQAIISGRLDPTPGTEP